MTIEIVGDREAISSLGIGVSFGKSKSDRHRFNTVCVPDIRVDRSTLEILDTEYEMTRPENISVDDGQTIAAAAGHAFPDGVASEKFRNEGPVTSNTAVNRTVTSLESIRLAIENQTGSGTAMDSLFAEMKRVDERVIGTGQTDQVISSELDSASEQTELGALNLETKADAECFLTRLDAKDSQITPIAETILEKFPVGGTSILAFAGSERNEQLEMVVAGTALAIRDSKQCRVLIIDSDVEGKHLTEMMGAQTKLGITDLAGGSGWQQVLDPTCDSGIHFLPVGQKDLAFPEKLASLLKKIVPNIVGHYDFVIVNVGDAHDVVAELWSNYTNGTFLLVSMTDTNQNIAKSAVAQLNSFGARLIGCIVSDSVS